MVDISEERMKELVKEYGAIAKKGGFYLNPNPKIVEGIIKGLINNEEKHGERYCPCRRVTGDKEEDKKIICPCIYHEKELEEMGHCHCQIYVREIDG